MADEKTCILDTILQAQDWSTDLSLNEILADLGLCSATYYRWCQRAKEVRLTDQVQVPRRTAMPPTPVEIAVTTGYARRQPLLG